MVVLGELGVVDRTAARCAGGEIGAEVFFSERPEDIAVAKAVCAECTQAGACLQGATARREPWGVWGGQLFVNGVAVPFKRPRGRPRKHPLPLPA